MIVTLITILEYVDNQIVQTRRNQQHYITSLNEQGILGLSLQDVQRIELLMKIQCQKEEILFKLITEIGEIYILCNDCVQRNTQVRELQIRLTDVHRMLRVCLMDFTENY